MVKTAGVLLRTLLGRCLRVHRCAQQRSLREVSTSAGVAMGYLSEIERGIKEPSSEVLGAVCAALDLELGDLLRAGLVELHRAEMPAFERRYEGYALAA